MIRIHINFKFEKQEKNAQLIAAQGGKLYDKFVGFVSDLEDVKKGIDNSATSIDEAMKKLSSGRGNIISQVEKMKTLGAKSKKSLPEDLIDSSIQ